MGSGISTEAADPVVKKIVDMASKQGLDVNPSTLEDLLARAPHVLDVAPSEGNTLVEAKAYLDALLQDPFVEKSPVEACKLLEEEMIQTVDIKPSGEVDLEQEGSDSSATDLYCNGLKLICRSSELLEQVDPEIRRRVVALDLSNCSVNALSPKMPFTRELVLSGCIFTLSSKGCNLSYAFPFLFVLDLSYVDLSDDLQLNAFGLSRMAQLVKLSLDGCNLVEIPCIDGLPRLTYLSLMENEIRSFGDTQHAGLEVLDLRENEEFRCGNGRAEEVLLEARERFPKLKMMNNQILNRNAKVVNYGDIAGLKDEFARTDTVADENEDRGSCSCLEGEPCAVEYTCKDWKNRFIIAEYARQGGE